MSGAVRVGESAIAWARSQAASPTRDWNALCLMFVRMCFGVAAKHPNAKTAWQQAKYRNATTNAASIPAGVPVFWQTKTANWHVAISIGGGEVYSTDVGGRGKVGRIAIDALSKAWGATLLGWTEDVNGVLVYIRPAIPPFPTGIGPGKSNPSARLLQRRLKMAGLMPQSVVESDNYGPKTQAAVIAFHKAFPQYRGSLVTNDPSIGPRGWKFLFTNWT